MCLHMQGYTSVCWYLPVDASILAKYKIAMHLKQKRVSEYCISKGLEEIDEEEYIQLLDKLLLKKLANKTDRISKHKAKDALMRKGFEPALVFSRLAQISE